MKGAEILEEMIFRLIHKVLILHLSNYGVIFIHFLLNFVVPQTKTIGSSDAIKSFRFFDNFSGILLKAEQTLGKL